MKSFPAASAPLMAEKTASSVTTLSMFQIVSPGAHERRATSLISSSVTSGIPSRAKVTGRSTDSMKAMYLSRVSVEVEMRTSWATVPKATRTRELNFHTLFTKESSYPFHRGGGDVTLR